MDGHSPHYHSGLRQPTTEEAQRPPFWRYWRDLPAAGRTGIFLKAWYSDPFLGRVYGEISQEEFDHALSRNLAFERTLAVDGAVILKFWLHLGRTQQKKAFRALESDPTQAWRVTKRDWEHWKRYDEFVPVAEHLIMRTSTGSAPWQIVEGFDARFRNLEVGTALLEAIRRGLATQEQRRREKSHAGDSMSGDGGAEDGAGPDPSPESWEGLGSSRSIRRPLQRSFPPSTWVSGWRSPSTGRR